MRKKPFFEKPHRRIYIMKFLFLVGIIFTSSYLYGYGITRLVYTYSDFSTPISYTGGDRIMENLDRGLVAFFDEKGDIYLSFPTRRP